MKNKQQCILVSGIYLSLIAVNSFRKKAECWSLICTARLVYCFPRYRKKMVVLIGVWFDHEWLTRKGELTYLIMGSQHPSLLIKSPYPGVSTMFKRNLTPFSTITVSKLVSFFVIQYMTASCWRTMRLRMNLCCRLRSYICFCPTFRFDQMRSEERIDQSGFAQPRLACWGYQLITP